MRPELFRNRLRHNINKDGAESLCDLWAYFDHNPFESVNGYCRFRCVLN
jgi:hypothetical protein